MLNMELGYVVENVVRGLHGDKNSVEASGSAINNPTYFHNNPTKALLLSFDIRASKYFSGGEEVRAGRMLHLLFHRFTGSSGFCSTYTFGAVCHEIFEDINKAECIEFLSSHDSCWNDAANAYINRVRSSIEDEMIAQCPKHFNARGIYWHVWFHRQNGNPFSWIDVEFFRVPRAQNFRDEVGVKLL